MAGHGLRRLITVAGLWPRRRRLNEFLDLADEQSRVRDYFLEPRGIREREVSVVGGGSHFKGLTKALRERRWEYTGANKMLVE